MYGGADAEPFADVTAKYELDFQRPQGVAVMPPGSAYYVADTANDRVQVLTKYLRHARDITTFASSDNPADGFSEPTGIGIDGDKNLFVLDTGNHRVVKFYFDDDDKETYRLHWGAAGNSDGEFSDEAMGLAVSWSDGSVYVADTGNHRVQKFDNDGVWQATWGSLGSEPGEFDAPAAVAVHPLNGDVYVLDTGNDRVQQFRSDGTFVRQWGAAGDGEGQFSNPKGIIVSARHGVFVMDTGNNRLQLFDYDGTFLGQWGAAGNGEGQFANATAIASNLWGVELDRCYVHDFQLTTGQPRRITVYYTTRNGLPRSRVPDNNADGHNIYAKVVAEWTQKAWDTYNNYDLGEPRHLRDDVDLGDGVVGKEFEVWIFNISPRGAGLCCGSSHYKINAPMVVDDVDNGEESGSGETALHETFHAVQTSAAQKVSWSKEGGAANAQDKVDADVDTSGDSKYIGRVNLYLRRKYKTSLSRVSYKAAVFWTYFEEQLGGGEPPEPGYGMSAVRHYFDIATSELYGLDAVARAVRDLSGSTRDLEDFWIDFTVANYTKRFANAGPRYRYVDEADTPYRDVPATVQPLDDIITPTVTLERDLPKYAANYVRVKPDNASCSYVTVGLRSDRRIGFTLADHRGDNLVRPPEQFVGKRHAVSRRVADAYGAGDGIGVILTGLDQAAEAALSAGCMNPDLSILRPTTEHPAWAGPFDDPGTIVVYVSLVDSDHGSVRGLRGGQFQVQIGDRPANFLRAVEVEDIYALWVVAPEQPADGDYDLEVTLDNSLTVTETEAVRYTDRVVEHMLVMDRSGSMGDSGKAGAARDAAYLQLAEMDRNAWAGLVSFATDARLDRSLRDVSVGQWQRSEMFEQIQIVSTNIGGQTAIVDGLNTALDELDDNGVPERGCGVTLFTDGMDNQSEEADRNALIARLQGAERPCPVYAVALGADADKRFLQQFADASGGLVYPATVSAASLAAARTADVQSVAAVGSLDVSWQNQLAGIFDDIAARLAGRTRVFAGANPTLSGLAIEKIPIDDSVTEAVFAVNGAPGIGTLPGLYDPDGTRVDEDYPDATIYTRATNWVIRVKSPKPGQWEVRLDGESDIGYIVLASANTPVALDVLARIPGSVPEAGHRVPIIGVLHDDEQMIPGASVVADIQDSYGDTAHLQLYDDGQHHDGEAGDGIYGNWFTRANSAPCHSDPELGQRVVCDNAYSVYAVATLGNVRREAQTGFAIQPGTDDDQDNMPDEWERDHGLDPGDYMDAYDDPDGDGLYNAEEFAHGTDPLNADTDGGGENDGSEVTRGVDPLDPADDGVPPMFESQARPFDGYVVLNYGVNSTFSFYRIFRRRLSPGTGAVGLQEQGGGWELVADQVLPTGVFTDTNVVNDTDYQYRVVPVTTEGAEGKPLESLITTPREDTDPPLGWIRINNGAACTARRRVTLQLEWDIDTTAMRLSNDPDFSNVAWEPPAFEREWDLASGLQAGGTGWVYVEFRDAAGNVSDYEGDSFDSIRLCPQDGDFDGDGSVDATDVQLVAGRWRQQSTDPGWNTYFDLDEDGVITVVDIMRVVAQWGKPVPTSTPTVTSTPTSMPTSTGTSTATATPVSPTLTSTPTPTPATPTSTDTPTATPMPVSPTPTSTPTVTSTPETPTPSDTSTATSMPATSTPTDTPTATSMPATSTPTDTPTATSMPATSTPTDTPTVTSTPVSPTPTDTPTVTSTPVSLTPTTVTVSSDFDAQVSSADGDTNYGDAETMLVGNLYSTSIYRAFVNFDLSTIPDTAVIQEAKLRMHTYTTYGGFEYETEVYRAKAFWSESTLTWNNQPALEPTGSRTTVDSISDWFEWDVTALVQDWLAGGDNYGLAVRAVDEDFDSAHEFDTREATYEGAQAPELIVTYQGQ